MHYFPPDQFIQYSDVHCPSGGPVERAAHTYFHQVVMSVAVGVVAFSVQAAIIFLGQLTGMQTVRGSESIPPGYTEQAGSPK
jgi:hypothetical protein